jgi:site-specific DNA recombinase
MKAAIYARVSSDRQDIDLSISAQLKALREYASRNGYVVVKEYIDEAESGKTTNRPQFREMIAQARRIPKLFAVVLVWKYSRFARNREDSIVFKAMLRKAGVQVISINEPLEDTPTGRLLEAMIESLDEFYSANLGEEVTRGMRESASRGFWVASYAPYGYRKVMVKDGVKERPKLEIEPSQSSVIQRIFQGITDGRGLIEIAKELNREGIVGPRGRGWGKTTIHKILTNEVYTGTLVWGRQSSRNLKPIRVENALPAIIDTDTFQQAQVCLNERAFTNKHPKRVASNYLLSGLARCGYCGKSLIGQDAKGGRFHYYVCGTLQKRGAGSCQAAYTSKERLEQSVIDKVKEHVLNYESLEELVRIVNDEMDSVARDYSERLNIVLEEIESVSQRLERLYDALETGSLKLADLAPRIQRLRQHQEQLNATRLELEGLLSDRKVELADAEAVKNCIIDLRTILEESTIAERKSFIKSIVREVIVTGSEVTLSYRPPLLAGMMSKETLSVPPIVHGGGR